MKAGRKLFNLLTWLGVPISIFFVYKIFKERIDEKIEDMITECIEEWNLS